MHLLQINLFGGIDVRLATGEAVPITNRKAAILLGYLALDAPDGRSRAKLAALLWDGCFGDNARASLRQALLSLRRVLPQYAEVIVTDRIDIRMRPNAARTDVGEFERLLQDGDPERLVSAAKLYRGELFDGVHADSCAFDAWLSTERQRLRLKAMRTVTGLLTDGGRERIPIATALAQRLLAIDPLQEDVHRVLMRCYVQQGRRADALRQYDFCRAALWKHIRATPDHETERLQGEIRRMLRA
ncbi:MAG: hypothetical protein HZA66_09410 [Rhodopseudomonas palustris]|uniref:Bacterial transcriptional activator domain-containing protein n=1 Tax=Rhodopseudomonas palustris TaxID=1076 RepID=A0A933RZ34_RHOPL|nr:hypothetical protein [Rhodopseudomonas palustris]